MQCCRRGQQARELERELGRGGMAEVYRARVTWAAEHVRLDIPGMVRHTRVRLT
jgi:hypothetical protein